jgi:predicted O-methyltransferase YrrM
VRGVGLDEHSITEARRIAAEAGVADRVSFTTGDAAGEAASAIDAALARGCG